MEEWILDDLLECSVCLERLDTSSKVLPCQHTFCKKCLEEISRTHSELRCPECRILVDTNIDDLPPNVLLMRILEGIRNVAPDQLSAKHQSRPSQSIDAHHNRNSSSPHTTKTNNKHPNQPCAQALYDYFSNEPGDLSFRKGEIINLRKKVDLNWYNGDVNGKFGVFPVNYVMVLEPLPSQIPECKALYDFKMTNDEEEGCLVFSKGELITVIRRVDENWAEGKLNNRIGIFPIAFVELNSVAKALMKLSVETQSASPRTAPPTPTSKEDAVHPLSGNHQLINPSNTCVLTTIATTQPTSDSSSTTLTSPSSTSDTTTPTTSSSPSSHASPSSPPRAISIPPNSVPAKRHSLGSTLPNGAKPNNKRHSAEILNNEEISNETQDTLEMLAIQHTNPPLERSGSQRLRKSSEVLPPTPGPQAQHSSLLLPALYVALFPYKPGNSDELELKRGGLYTVTERCQDGWFKGHHFRSQKAGVFPGNYVAPARSLPALQAQVRGICRPKPSGTSTTSRNGTPPLEPRSPISYLKPQPVPPHKENSRANNTTVQSPSSLPPEMTSAVVPPPNVSVPSASPKNVEKSKEKKDKGGLMRRLTSMKKSKSPPPTPYSMDNPVFEDTPILFSPPVHVRSGSCPNQLISPSCTDNRLFSPTSSQRSKVKERPSIPKMSSRMIHHRKSSSMDTPCSGTDASHAIGKHIFLDEKGFLGNRKAAYLNLADITKPLQSKDDTRYGGLAGSATSGMIQKTISTSKPEDDIKCSGLAGSGTSGMMLKGISTPKPQKDPSYGLACSASSPSPFRMIHKTISTSKPEKDPSYGLAGSAASSPPSGMIQKTISTSKHEKDPSYGLAGSAASPPPSGMIQKTISTSKHEKDPSYELAGSATSPPPSGMIQKTISTSKPENDTRYGLAGSVSSSGMTQKAISASNSEDVQCFGLAGSKYPVSSYIPKFLIESQTSDQGDKQTTNKSQSRSSNELTNKFSKWSLASPDQEGKPVSKGLPLPRERFRCIVPYPPNSEYELELQLGDVIYVHKKRDDGWYKGTQQRTGRTGLFPASFVQSF